MDVSTHLEQKDDVEVAFPRWVSHEHCTTESFDCGEARARRSPQESGEADRVT